MKLLKLIVTLVVWSSSMTYALNPIPKWYGGFIVGGSRPPDIDFAVPTPINKLSGTGNVSYSILGNVGGQIGYRFKQLRAEGEFFFNNNPFSHLNIDGFNIPNYGSSATTISQLAGKLVTVANPFSFSGYTNTYALMLNGYYDLYIPNYTEHVVPYVGAGIGYQKVLNVINFYDSSGQDILSSKSSAGFTETHQNFAAQAIAGISYYLTDYTAFSLDFRYLSSTQIDYADSRFNSFQGRPQLYSINFIFNCAFNLG